MGICYSLLSQRTLQMTPKKVPLSESPFEMLLVTTGRSHQLWPGPNLLLVELSCQSTRCFRTGVGKVGSLLCRCNSLTLVLHLQLDLSQMWIQRHILICAVQMNSNNSVTILIFLHINKSLYAIEDSKLFFRLLSLSQDSFSNNQMGFRLQKCHLYVKRKWGQYCHKIHTHA